jgi:hypothetical protein
VGFLGFGFIFIRRDIVEKVGFRGGVNNEHSFDLGFAMDTLEHKIPIHVDLRANMDHLKWRMGYGVYENWGRTVDNVPHTSFEQYNPLSIYS